MQPDKLNHYLEARLSQWAEWYSQGNTYGLGYPPAAIEYRLMREGVIIRSLHPQPLPCHELAEEMEALVGEMAKQAERMAQALRYYYFHPGSLRRQSAQCQLSYTHYRSEVEKAKQWLLGRLTAKPLKPLYA